MKIEERWTYDAPADRVIAMMIDPAFQEAKCVATKALSHKVVIKTKKPLQIIETHREMATTGLPDQVTKIIGSKLKIVETQMWGEADSAGSRIADLDVSLVGVPVTYRGTITMTADGAQTHMHVLGELKARVMFIGGRIENAAAPAFTSGVKIEAETGHIFLQK